MNSLEQALREKGYLPKQNKMHAEKVTAFGRTFHSKREAQRYGELILLQKAGVIQNLECQVPFELLPPQKINGKVVERACKYKADFVYYEDGKLVVEDSKGYRTKDYIIKRKLMLYIHGIKIKET